MCRFLLISLNIDAILRGVTIAERRKKLEEMTLGNGLSDAYTATLTRLRAQAGNKSVLGLKALMWILNSQRPLRVEELCHALAVEIGSVDLDPEKVPQLQTVLSSCLGLVKVETTSRTVRLVHFTLHEHLMSDHTLFNNFHNPHSAIAEVCLTYLNFGYVRGLPPDLDHTPPAIPFLDYASCFWGEHARREMTDIVKVLALRLLDRFDEHISATQLLLRHNKNSIWKQELGGADVQRKYTGLHGAALFGVGEIVTVVMKINKWDINAGDCFGRTALSWAVERGHEAVVKILLEQKDVNPDQADTIYGLTPLALAAMNGDEGIVKMLLEREEVIPDQADAEYGATPLWWAAQNGHMRVVKMLLERQEVNPDRDDTKFGATSLFMAAQNGHEGVVRILLEREEVNPDHADTESGTTPLCGAAANGHGRVVKMLLEREEVNPDRADTKYGRTPLSWAAGGGNEGVVNMLLGRKDVVEIS